MEQEVVKRKNGGPVYGSWSMEQGGRRSSRIPRSCSRGTTRGSSQDQLTLAPLRELMDVFFQTTTRSFSAGDSGGFATVIG